MATKTVQNLIDALTAFVAAHASQAGNAPVVTDDGTNRYGLSATVGAGAAEPPPQTYLHPISVGPYATHTSLNVALGLLDAGHKAGALYVQWPANTRGEGTAVFPKGVHEVVNISEENDGGVLNTTYWLQIAIRPGTAGAFSPPTPAPATNEAPPIPPPHPPLAPTVPPPAPTGTQPVDP